MAAKRGVDVDWLNDGVKAFLPGTDPGATVLFERPGLAVSIASPRYLLAMKVMAARIERDEDDILALAHLEGLGTAAEVVDVAVSAYPDLVIAPRVQFFLEELFATRASLDDRAD